ncbi:hypothetical protein EUTSA_v10000517mg [Eutrema salsugineum]|uniref:asparagine--tRNA ligase n=1 Tax=Eutrema salsugineum TaxID=72664 RepID=V4NJ62_EUTSA|nr:hypothetical protein EUTSA_v10000517mg [Eutrema salsugineum]
MGLSTVYKSRFWSRIGIPRFWNWTRIQRFRSIPPPADQLAAAVSLDNDAALSSTLKKSRFSDRVCIKSILSQPDGGAGLAGEKVRISGWVKTGREQGKGSFAFLEVNDGSCAENLQVMVDASVSDLSKLVATGTCVTVYGCLKIPPQGKGTKKQKIELRAEKVTDVGTVDPSTYPIPKTKLSLEYLRDYPHLRARTTSIAAIARIRNALAMMIHSFLQEEGFIYVNTPIITTNDCEGGGEMFRVITTLMKQFDKLEKEFVMSIEAAKIIVKEKSEALAKLKAAKASKEEITASVAELTEAKEALAKLEERLKLKKDEKTDSLEFFSRQTFLTVSGQLHAEAYACSMGRVYTLSPAFRAENSHTSRHLSEFWMVEPELAFADIEEAMNCAEALLKFILKGLLEKYFDKGCIDRIKLAASTPFGRVTYTEAIKLLEEAVAQGKTFENQVKWGIDLASEHERYLTEVVFQKLLFVYNYPKDIKAFYMRVNDDGKTVAAFDLLVPKVGELIGGGQREERLDNLIERMEEMGLSIEQYQWYIDFRRHGTAKHSGFGMGFERMVLFATGVDNIRDVIPFPRYSGRADL